MSARPRRNRRHAQPDELQRGYLEFLEQHCGLGPSAIEHNRTAVTEFLEFCKRRDKVLDALAVVDLDAYLDEVAHRGFGKSFISSRLSGLRGFLRYLFAEGALQKDLSSCLSLPMVYRDARVPPHFTWSELEQLVASVQGDDPEALRDRLILALLCTYGLRGIEVARLTLDDVDLRQGALRIRSLKRKQDLLLPLVDEVVVLIRQYVQIGRPHGPHRELLLNGRAAPLGREGLTKRLRVLVERAGLGTVRNAHAIRRAVGTRLIEQGRGEGIAAQVLGHASLASTRIYLRLSTDLLRDVAENYGEVL